MSVTIIECAVDSITLTSFVKKEGALVLKHEGRKALQYVSSAAVGNWTADAVQAIQELVAEAKVIFPVSILLPGFVLLIKVMQVPRVIRAKQAEIIQTHIHELLGTGKEEHLAYDIVDVREYELEVVCTLVKKDWMESFCRVMESIGVEIISIEPSAIHYYNIYRKEFPKVNTPTLLVVIQHLSVCYIIFDVQIAYIYYVLIKDDSLIGEICELINRYNKKNPKCSLRDVRVLNQSTHNKDFVNQLEQCTGLRCKAFLPFSGGSIYAVGSIGAAHQKVFGEGLSINLVPSIIKKSWGFERSKKAMLIAGTSIVVSFLIVLNTLNYKRAYYKEKGDAFEAKLRPLKEWAVVIKRNEQLIAFYNEGLGALETYIQSNKSWVHFLNSLQDIFIGISGGRVDSLKIVELENRVQNSWKDEFMGFENIEPLVQKSRLMQITGSFLLEANESANSAMEKVRLLMSEFEKLEFVTGARSFHFDTQHLPKVSFAISLSLTPQIF